VSALSGSTPRPKPPLLVLGSRRRYDRGRQASGSPVDAVA